ncbi:4-(cytidine 5'-diphospho)-2-C-methyl-D-erythritol kinase [Xanthomonas vasicola]|uniref:4-diphosphocytidyl-2-C-methyl-D-erythritol kinase n=1 Tax=Xanthomonas vasicola pv. vasculorum NCPPB 890 TaxID=1184265 RepID=A0A836P432_XANVA|nr:4-(cytidine 5'-diphospho)-2-C-methyl-D-erythritol kinase [Xanthomonas vasicola]KFA30420.1 kinase [Xanthomonas vasicola pv. vasculorum NCPPB 1326]KFA30520.1 kinase [Xanthomonas vasicola pv. vasculorum NCPPB 1381]MBV6745171.1 4-(cytidine 5'-diphospho)-2-C-methyl-D-erythritol kinase [Xanthomonas vasicola pv. vasculorum NCPPB 890]MBV6890574.1 4-(cytidine 5'-diphospho)-2-C-methyl-D-erythritol kinase [Xanthomonas vasicola pv. vasculorum]MDO6946525.1 4-(cytidine 5'-diphospho)-2-C-methyl-D-erythrit
MDRIALMDAPGNDWSAWPAPAKLNLFLQITGRCADGYHLLQTVFRLLDWGDTIHLRLRSDGQILRIGESLPGVAEDDDLVIRAARLLQSATGAGAGAEIRVDKRIPAGGGFGGGSSDAATVLVALNALWGLGLEADALAELGLQLGADVPVFVRGRNAWAEGVGEQLTPIALPKAAYLLVDPGVHVPTPVLFRSQELTRDAAPAKIPDFASGSLLDNAFEPVLRRREPAVEAVFQALSRVGTPRLTGSGSGCFVEFATRAAAEQAMAQLPDSLRAWVVEGAAHSPLLDARDAMKF